MAEKETLSYCRSTLQQVRQAAWAKGYRPLSQFELQRIRRSQNWHEFEAGERDSDGSQSAPGAEVINWGTDYSAQDEYAFKHVPGLNLLQASAGLAGGGMQGRRTDQDPKPMGKMLKRLVRRFGWQGFLLEGNLRANWPKIVGEVIAAHAQIETIRDGQIVLRCDSTRWATELRLLIPQLMAAIERNAGGLTIKQLVVLGPAQPSWKHGKRTVRGRGVRDTYA